MKTYDFAYQLLPELVVQYNQGVEQQQHLVDMHYLRSRYCQDKSMPLWQEVSIEHRPLSEHKSVGIYHFGEPHLDEKPFYGLIFFDYEAQNATYYTLERSTTDADQEHPWSVVQVNHPGLRLEFGPFMMRPTAHNFVNYVYENYEDDELFEW